MERTKLKLTVIVLLAILNLCLLGVTLFQHHQASSYEKLARTQALAYLENHGVTAKERDIPWESSLTTEREELEDQILDPAQIPTGGLAMTCEIHAGRQPETLLVDFTNGLKDLQTTCTQINTVTEGYAYTSEGDRGILTPVWRVETDQGIFLLDCASGSLSYET